MASQVEARLQLTGSEKFTRDMKKAGDSGSRALRKVEKGGKPASKALLGVSRATRGVRDGMEDLSGRAGVLGRTLTALGPAGIAAGAALGATAAGLTAAFRASQQLDQLDDTATKLGVSVELLQELRFAAQQNGITVQNTDLALQRFIRRMAEAANGTGEAKAALDELNVPLRTADGRIRATDDVLSDLADAFARVPDQADRLRLAFKLFDSEGAQFVNVLQGGSVALAELRQQARDTGAVVDEALVKKASEFQDRWSAAMQSLSGSFQSFLIDAGFIELLEEVVDRVTLLRVESESLTAKRIELRQATEELQKQEAFLLKLQQAGATDFAIGRASDKAKELRRIIGDINVDIFMLKKQLRTAQQDAAGADSPAADIVVAPPNKPTKGRFDQRAQDKLLKKKQRELELLRATSNEAKSQVRIEQQLDAVRAQMTDENLARYRQVLEQIEAAKTANEQYGKTFDDVKQKIKDMAREGKFEFESLKEVAINALVEIASQRIEGVFNPAGGAPSSGGFGGIVQKGFGMAGGFIEDLVGGMFGFANGGAFDKGRVQAYASGGVVDSPTFFGMKGGMGLAGEAGPEAILPLSRGSDGRLGVEVKRESGGVNVTYNIDARGAEAGVENRIRAVLQQELPNISTAVERNMVRRANAGGSFAQAMGRRP